MIHALASLRHFGDHLAPIWSALPPESRGTFYGPAALPPRRDPSRLFLVAGYADAQAVAPNPYVWCDHGSGQSYVGITNGSYSGGEGHDRCVLFLTPSERVSARWRDRYPDTPAVAIGCPRLDRLYHGRLVGVEQLVARRPHKPQVVGSSPTPATSREVGFGRSTSGVASHAGAAQRGQSAAGGNGPGEASPPIVAISYHWDCALLPETRSAWRYYDPHLPRLVRDPRFRVVGHGHPRLWPTIRRRWAELGVEQWPDVDRVLSEADLLVVDNSSVAFEMAAIGKPVVLLNLPSYRRDVEHGGRFWSSPPGSQVDHPSELADAIACALTDPAHRAIRARAVEWAYGGPITGDASERAASAIMEVLNARA